MSIQSQPIAPIPVITQQVAKAVFPKGNPYLTLRDELGTVFDYSDFTSLFSATGQPGLPAMTSNPCDAAAISRKPV